VDCCGETRLLAIDEILDLLKNGEWHELKEVAGRTHLREVKVEIISSFLAEYDFLEFDEREKKIKLSPQLRLFLKKIEGVEEETGGR
jgi:DNA-binding IclR family transcriptional regulator